MGGSDKPDLDPGYKELGEGFIPKGKNPPDGDVGHQTVYGEIPGDAGYHFSWDQNESGDISGAHVTDHSDGSITGFDDAPADTSDIAEGGEDAGEANTAEVGESPGFAETAEAGGEAVGETGGESGGEAGGEAVGETGGESGGEAGGEAGVP